MGRRYRMARSARRWLGSVGFLLVMGVTPPAQGQIGTGSFCSLVAADGVWSAFISYDPIAYNCARARTWLAGATTAPLVNANRGLFRAYGWNTATMTCVDGSRVATGLGSQPLEQVFYWAQSAGLSGCLMRVW